MKKPIIFASLATLVMASCTSEEPMPQTEVTHESTSTVTESLSRTRTLDEAAKIATDAIGMLPQGDSRGAARTFRKENVKYGIALSKSRSGGNDTLMYVFNFDDEQGFAVVAADKAVDGLIAVTELGSYDPDITPDNPGLADYMNIAKSYLTQCKDSVFDCTSNNDDGIITDLAEYKTEVIDILKVKYEPNYNLRWGQNYPEGELFNNGVAGCTNTAMMTIMSYFEYPSVLHLTYEDCQNERLFIDWSLLKTHTQSFFFEPYFDQCQSSTYDIHTVLSKAYRQLKELNSSDDSQPKITYTIVGKEINTLRDFGYQVSDYMDYSSDLLLSMIRSGCKVIVSAKNKSSNTGHCWVIDGLDYHDWWSGEYIREKGKDWVLINDHGVYKSRMNHMNWGWNGYGNGFFNSNVFDADICARLDDPNKPADIHNENNRGTQSYTNIKIASVRIRTQQSI